MSTLGEVRIFIFCEAEAYGGSKCSKQVRLRQQLAPAPILDRKRNVNHITEIHIPNHSPNEAR